MKFKLTIAYDGTDFNGWQVQLHKSLTNKSICEGRTVQGELTRALSLLEGAPVQVYGAGRTDAGVHAEAQTAHVKLERFVATEKLAAAINGNLPADCRVICVKQVADDFHARYSATGKTYRYRIFNERFASPFLARYSLQEGRTLNVEAMQRAAQLFLGEHDWTAFSSVHADVQGSRVRRVTKLEVSARYDEIARGRVIEITAEAEGFLRYMVRSIAGTLLSVGRAEMLPAQVEQAIATRRRELAGATAAAHGLTLVRVHY